MTSNDSLPMNGVPLVARAQGAFLGAATGDALGWPQEDRSSRIGKSGETTRDRPRTGFQRWVRRSGGRYYSHEEIILAGEYSDDTQLLLCTARSLLHGVAWWQHLTKRELPVWPLYERGGGRATKSAIKAWLTGQEPWSSTQKQDREFYFNAGGNGVAMRIMPHCLIGVKENDFGVVAKNILADGVCTHGHPRALVGALAYGFAVWEAFRGTDTLQYGAIIEKVLSGTQSWSILQDLADLCPTWRASAEKETSESYEEGWKETVSELLLLLKQCQEAMKQGALPVDQETLKQLGCFDRRINGAGTVTAAASIFLASRYAVDPLHGLLEAAFSEGADTDTIASMTGGLLGAMVGREWLENYAKQVQDASYLEKIAKCIITKNDSFDTSKPIRKVTKTHLDSFLEKLEALKSEDDLSAPDSREVRVTAQKKLETRARNIQVFSWRLITSDGQSLYIKKISRNKRETEPKESGHDDFFSYSRSKIQLQPIEITMVGIKLPVRNIVKARFFYEKILGLEVVKEARNIVNLNGVISLVPMDYDQSSENQQRNFALKSSSIYIRTRSIEEIYNNTLQFPTTILTQLSRVHEQRFFRCLDPDGNIVEVVEGS